MKPYRFYFAGSTGAMEYCRKYLRSHGCPISSTPAPDITHLLLPVPSFEPDGSIKGGGRPEPILRQLPEDITVIGGNLSHPALERVSRMDLLEDPVYLSENASITAHCALKTAMNRMNITFRDCPVLVVGWGRIGKCLAALLKELGARVSVSVRRETDRAMLPVLGYETVRLTPPAYDLQRFRVIFNTVPVMLLPEDLLEQCAPDCLKIDLASTHGMGGQDVVWAKGLPNREAPETSGLLIGRTVLRLLQKQEGCL